ncbi:aminoglycoside phosphotransferase family protein [Leucobacter sp. cx-328]|nr:aminoglycoside phosphotransferase family protein [Leucobacter sp. cx-328]
MNTSSLTDTDTGTAKDAAIGVHLPGGSGGVWKIATASGEMRVHRPTGAWTPAVHELLQHLHSRNVAGVPQLFGIDADGREVLEFLPGNSVDPDGQAVSDKVLAEAAAWLRTFHDAVVDFTPTSDVWRPGTRSLEPGEIICHNDPGLTNWVVTGDKFSGMIDWDRAAPGRPIDDVAFLCWSAIPLMREAPIADVARRIELVARSYGGIDPLNLLDAVSDRMELISERWRAGIAAEDPGTIALRDSGIMAKHEARVAGFNARKPGISVAVSQRLRA